MSGLRSACAVLLAAVSCAVGAQPPRVVEVQPSAEEVPENLLRISLRFDAPVAEEVLSRLSLRHADDRAIDRPFLPQELWSPDGRILTILLHPGRVKTGLVARETLGPFLVAGEEVVLMMDGQPLRRWTVAPADTEGPVVARWHVSPAPSGTRQPLVVTLDGPIDGRDVDFIAVVGSDEQRVEGQARLRDGERAWTFAPNRRWRPGSYRLIVRETLEDAAGNRLGGRFETSMLGPQAAPRASALSFSVRNDGAR